jgi:polysaccharide deacetylase family protein (PEP-CTERM system associated)
MLTNALTVDVEDYFQVSALAPYVPRSEWPHYDCRVEKNVDRLLQMMADRSIQATFFTLGWVGERYAQMVRRIVDSGHELASHGYGHQRASEQTEEAFAADVRLAKILLEDIGGVEVKGYRAPSFSIGEATPWAYDCLAQAGYRYSSSVYPIRHDHYGNPNGERFAHDAGAGLIELPLTTVRLLGRNWPASGGGYFRLLPYALSRGLLRYINRVDQRPAIFYFHPWEIDHEQPRMAGVDPKTRFRHYLNLDRMQDRLTRLIADFRWTRVDALFFDRGGNLRCATQSQPAIRAVPA